MDTRFIAFGATGLAALASLLAVVVLPWAWYGDIDIPLHRLPSWGVHLATVLVLYAAIGWTLLASAGRRALPAIVAVGAGTAAVGTAVLVALGYDEAAALFEDPVPAVLPGLGPGLFVGVLAVLLGLSAVVASSARR